MLKGKKILVGVTGGIAAYKTPSIVRLLVKEGCEVMVIMTDHAKNFITPLTLSTLSRNPVLTEFFNPENGNWNSHIDLGTWADLFLIAPATANTMAKWQAELPITCFSLLFFRHAALFLLLRRWTLICSNMLQPKRI